MKMTKCPRCDSASIDSGWIVSAGKISYRSRRQRHPFVSVNCTAEVCLDCGYTEMRVDEGYRNKVKQMKTAR